jgi:hypothetical protein
VVYALHAFSLLTGIIGTATIIGAFLTGWPSIIAVILNHPAAGDRHGQGRGNAGETRKAAALAE